VVEELAHRVAEQGALVEAAEAPFVVGERGDAHGAVHRAARGPADDQCDRGRHAGDRADAAGDFLDVDAGIGEGLWHGTAPGLGGAGIAGIQWRVGRGRMSRWTGSATTASEA